MWRNSLGVYTVATEFIPWFPETKKEFKPLEIKRVYYEDKEAKTAESVCGAGHETQGGIAPQDQQTTTPAVEPATGTITQW